MDTNYQYIHNDKGPSTPGSLELMTLSPSVVQITMDYLYVRKQLVDAGAEVQTDMGQDMALSIVCDAYNHEAAKRGIQIYRVDDSVSDHCNNG